MALGAHTRHIYHPGNEPYKLGGWVERAGERKIVLAENINRAMGTCLRWIGICGIPQEQVEIQSPMPLTCI